MSDELYSESFTCRPTGEGIIVIEIGRNPPDTDDEFDSGPLMFCNKRKEEMHTGYCILRYVAINAFKKDRSKCYRCPQGRQVRDDFADS